MNKRNLSEQVIESEHDLDETEKKIPIGSGLLNSSALKKSQANRDSKESLPVISLSSNNNSSFNTSKESSESEKYGNSKDFFSPDLVPLEDKLQLKEDEQKL